MARSRAPDQPASRSALKPSVIHSYDPCRDRWANKKDLQAAEVRDGAMRDREVILSGYGQTPIRQRQQKSPKRQPGEPRMPNHVRLAQANRQPLFDKR